MKIAIVTPTPIPFIMGGAEKFFIGMLYNFNKFTNYQFDLIKIPVKDQEFWELIQGYYNFYHLDLSHFDAVITTKYPAWMIRHKNHIIYMQHTCRGVYDLYHFSNQPIDYNDLIDDSLIKLQNLLISDNTTADELFEELFILKDKTPQKFIFPNPLTRAIIHKLDSIALKNIKSFNAISKNVATRQDYFPSNKDIKIIHHPSNLENLYSKDYKYIFTISRLEKIKRVDYLIKAFKQTKGNIQFLIAGKGSEEKYLKQLAKGDDRIKFLGFVSDEKVKELYANALFVPFMPYDEDYGLITIEAMSAYKAVLTTNDSGGVNEFINETNGIVVSTDISDISQAMQTLIDNPKKTIQMGKNAKKSISHITWENVAANLFSKEIITKSFKYIPSPIIKQKKILLLNTFSIQNPISGGQLRIYNLYKNSPYQVVHLCIGDKYHKIQLTDSLIEIQIPKTPKFKEIEAKLQLQLNISATDICFMNYFKTIPQFIEVFKSEYLSTDYLILEHPYTYPLIKEISFPYNIKYIYSAHNIEYILKSQMINNKEILDKLFIVEKFCTQNAYTTIVCTQEDKNRLQQLYKPNKIEIIENGANFPDIQPLKRDNNTILFIGSYHKPNIEAVEEIIKIAPKLPQYQFIIIGSVYKAFINHKNIKNIKFLGIVDNSIKEKYLKTSLLALNPIISGSGSNLKVFEYLSYNIPIVSSKIGIRGIDLDITTYKDLNHLIDIIKNNKFITSKEIYNKAKSKYSWENIVKKLHHIIY